MKSWEKQLWHIAGKCRW